MGDREVPAPGEEGSSRLTPDDRIRPERRVEPRRVEDRIRIAALQKRYAFYRRVALRAVIAWAIVATAGVIALALQNQDTERAAKRAERNTAQVDANYRVVRAEASGQCYRLAYLRWQEDKKRYADWQRDRQAAYFLSHALTPGVRALGGVFAHAAANDYFLRQTDCAAATNHPTTYRSPGAVPFARVDRGFLNTFLLRPPEPPGR